MARGVTRRTFLVVSGAAFSVAAPGGLTKLLRAQEAPLPAIGPAYVAVAPRILRTGQSQTVSISLLRGEQPTSGGATVTLLKDTQPVAEVSGWVPGHGTLALQLPADLADGSYDLRVDTLGFQDQTPIRVESGTLLFVETDKPIYKPGQTMHIRVLAVDPALRPASGEATVEVMDAKGTRVFKRTLAVDDFGMASTDLPLSTEPNLGVWKVNATLGQRSSQVDVRVERYTLPKYEVRVDLARAWALVSEPIRGTVRAEYSFGKPVRGNVEIVASRYVGTWQEYARSSGAIDGDHRFELPPVQYAAGSPAGRGMAQVQLEVTVREPATGYEESITELVTVAARPVSVQVIPESATFKPGLPLSMLVLVETPDGQPVDADVTVRLSYQNASLSRLEEATRQVPVRNGAGSLQVTPPAGAASVSIQASATDASPTTLALRAGYSPSGTFVHLEQLTHGALKVGDTVRFKVHATREAANFYFEVLGRGTVLFSDVSPTPEVALTLTPSMAPEARLLVYQVVGGSEVAADFLPFKVEGSLPHAVQVMLPGDEARPGEELEVGVQTEGEARVGLAAVDRSVFILAENRLNLRQVFDELERLYQQPQVELHEVEPIGPIPLPGPAPRPLPGPVPEPMPGGVVPRGIAPPVRGVAAPVVRSGGAGNTLPGAREIFQDAGVVVLTNREVPNGKSLMPVAMAAPLAAPMAARAEMAGAVPAAVPAPTPTTDTRDADLAEVQRVRQFFPETWVWSALATDAGGRTSQRVTAPDSITTWMFRAVALSKEKGLGIGEAQLRVFQPFFVQADLPYAAIRGEEFPARVALYNYAATSQEFVVDLEASDWFDLLDDARKTVTVDPSNVGGVAFTIRPTGLGVKPLKVTARSRGAADAIIKELIVEPEGVQREVVENFVLTPGAAHTVVLTTPPSTIQGSTRAFVALTGNMLSQSMDGLEQLLKMPFGCGEQNMILFAPNVFVTRYLKETGQIKPEVMAKAEHLMLTGYQRQLIYRRDDGSFSAFGQQDREGSLWLTAFVLKTFAQARGLIFVDDALLGSASSWVRRHQNADGSFDPVGFVHHQELLGGLSGRTALTAFTAVALREAGEDDGAAIRYLEQRLDTTDDVYALALSAYALAFARSNRAQQAHDRLMARAQESDAGLWWEPRGQADDPFADSDSVGNGRAIRSPRPAPSRSAAIETTGYATLALLAHGDTANAGRAVRWLASKRNAQGGFGSTQDTVVALQALAQAAVLSRADVDATVTLRAGSWSREVRVGAENADVVQLIAVPTDATDVTAEMRGKGQVLAQSVLRFNLPDAQAGALSAFQVDVRYGADRVAVDDLLDITATVRFTPPEPVAAGMVVVDIAVPTGFEPVADTMEALVRREPKLKRFEVAGRKVVFYVEDLQPNEQIALAFQARALYPVRAQAVASQAYAYYRPEWSGESLGGAIEVA